MCTMLIASVRLKRLSLVETANPHALVAEQSTNGNRYEVFKTERYRANILQLVLMIRLQGPPIQ